MKDNFDWECQKFCAKNTPRICPFFFTIVAVFLFNVKYSYPLHYLLLLETEVLLPKCNLFQFLRQINFRKCQHQWFPWNLHFYITKVVVPVPCFLFTRKNQKKTMPQKLKKVVLCNGISVSLTFLLVKNLNWRPVLLQIGAFVSFSKSPIKSRFQNPRFCPILKLVVLSPIFYFDTTNI